MNDMPNTDNTRPGTKTINSLDIQGRGRVYNNITETIGNTPLVRLPRLTEATKIKGEILLKLEFFNPLASVKDRIGVSMVDALEESGHLKPGGILIEPTSGNTGIGLAYVCAARGYRLVLVMPESMSIERRKILAHLGADLVLTPAANGMKGALLRAEELLKEILGSMMPRQFFHPANPLAHYETTAVEIWNDTGGNVDALVVGVGTGGTLTGCAQRLKPLNPNLRVIAVEPSGSPVLSGGQAGPHQIQGIGAGFIPTLLEPELIDEVITVPDQAAIDTAQLLAKLEGIPGGISTGANLAAAVTVAARPEMAGKTIVTFAPSFAERYLSTPLFDYDV